MGKRHLALVIILMGTLLTAMLAAQNPVTVAKVGSVTVTTTIPVSGTITVPLPSGAATATLQGVTDTDDASIATGQTAAVSLALSMAYDGSVWRRLTFGTAGTASAQVLTVQGIASMTPFLVAQATAANLNATVVGTGTFAVQAAQSGTWNITNVSGTVSLPTGAATAAKQPALGTAGTASADVITVQGITSMTPFLVAQATAANLNATVVGTGTFAVQAAQSGTWTVQPGNTANTTPWLATIAQGGNSAAVNASGQLSITCANCSGSGASAVDNSAFTAGTTSGAPIMGFYHSTIDTVTDGRTATVAMDSKRNLFNVIRDAAGNARGVNVTAGNALTVDASATTQPVSAASLPLPTGAATAAKQPALGTAGSPSLDVLTTQGIVGGYPMAVIGTALDLTALQSGATANGNGTVLDISGYSSVWLVVNCATCSGGTTVNFEGGDYLSNFGSLPAYQTTSTTPTWAISTTTAGLTYWRVPTAGVSQIRARISGYSAGTVTVNAQRSVFAAPLAPLDVVNLAQVGGTTTDTNSGSKSAGTLRVVLATDQPALTNRLLVTPDSVALPANQSVNTSQINGVTPLMGNGVTGTGSQRVTIASDNTAFAVNGTLQTQTDTVMVGGVNVKEINAVTPLMGNGATGTGALRVSIANDSTGVVQPGNTANTTPWLVSQAAGTSATLAVTGCYLQSAASTNATNCKASAGNYYGFSAINTTATLYYLRMYNASGTPTCSSATGFINSYPIPASATGSGMVHFFDTPVNYGTGIAFCITGGGSSTDNTNAATGVYLEIHYK